MLSKKDLSHSVQVDNFTGRWVHSVKDFVQKKTLQNLSILYIKNFNFPSRKEEEIICFTEKTLKMRVLEVQPLKEFLNV